MAMCKKIGVILCCIVVGTISIKGSQPPILSLDETDQDMKLTCSHNSKAVQWWQQDKTMFMIGFYNGTCLPTRTIPWYMHCDCIAPTYSCDFTVNKTTVAIVNNTSWKCSVGIDGYDVSSNEIILLFEDLQPPVLTLEGPGHDMSMMLTCKHNSRSVQWWYQNKPLFEIGLYDGSCASSIKKPWYMDCYCIPPSYTCTVNPSEVSVLNNTVWKCSVGIHGIDVSSNEITFIIPETIMSTPIAPVPSEGLNVYQIIGICIGSFVVLFAVAVVWIRKQVCNKEKRGNYKRTSGFSNKTYGENKGKEDDYEHMVDTSKAVRDDSNKTDGADKGKGDDYEHIVDTSKAVKGDSNMTNRADKGERDDYVQIVDTNKAVRGDSNKRDGADQGEGADFNETVDTSKDIRDDSNTTYCEGKDKGTDTENTGDTRKDVRGDSNKKDGVDKGAGADSVTTVDKNKDVRYDSNKSDKEDKGAVADFVNTVDKNNDVRDDSNKTDGADKGEGPDAVNTVDKNKDVSDDSDKTDGADKDAEANSINTVDKNTDVRDDSNKNDGENKDAGADYVNTVDKNTDVRDDSNKNDCADKDAGPTT